MRLPDIEPVADLDESGSPDARTDYLPVPALGFPAAWPRAVAASQGATGNPGPRPGVTAAIAEASAVIGSR